MIIIAESGSTKTDWCILNKSTRKNTVLQSQGLNPYFLDEKKLLIQLKIIFPPLMCSSVEYVFFYGAGCSHEEQKQKVNHLLKRIFKNALINVETDLLAAARGAFIKEEGLVCILGTGSNAGLYKNQQIEKSFPSLGFIFGDEGSGSHIGKKIIEDFLNNKLPSDILNSFFSSYQINYYDIIKNVYSEKYPNRYLASFSEFVYKNISNNYCKSIVYNSFEDFFIKRISAFNDYKSFHIKFTGTIAYVFSNLLLKTAEKFNIKLCKNDIIKSPLKGLIKYHSF